MVEITPSGPDGALDAAMTAVFGRSWRTKIAGFASLACGLIVGVEASAPGTLPHMLVVVASVAAPLVAGLGLYHAKDHVVSGPPNT